jgi:hypothetical protein
MISNDIFNDDFWESRRGVNLGSRSGSSMDGEKPSFCGIF